jgi:TonB family protein
MMRMSRLRFLVALFAVAGVCHSQAIKDGTDTLRDAVLKQQLYLRGFSADDDIRWRWKDGVLVADKPSVYMLSALDINSVKVSGSTIEISAVRLAVFRNKRGAILLLPLKEAVKVTVDLSGADVAAVLPHVAEALFYRDVNEALSALPPAYKDVLPLSEEASDMQDPLPSIAGCGCVEDTLKKCVDTDWKSAGAKLPKVLYTVEPGFSEEARRRKFNGNVETGITVDASGKVSDIWMLRPAGMGLDQQAVKAVRQYRFAPATCHGQPAETHLAVGINFQIF